MRTRNHFSSVWLMTAASVMCIFVVAFSGCVSTNRSVNGKTALSLWNDDAPARNVLIDFVESVTDKSSADFIPEEDRIAVFDFDGTLFCETDPNYFDYTLLNYRVTEDPEYKNRASAFEREVAQKIQKQNETGESFTGLEVDHGKAVASSFKGMTLSEFDAYIQNFKKTPMPSYIGMNRGDGFYAPMLQVVEYLEANGFTVYVVSGTDRFIVRGIIKDSPLKLSPGQIIGSDETLAADGQGNADGLNYQFTLKDRLVTGGTFIIKNLKMNKVSVIMKEIGQQPVLSFGNSTGDSSMANFTITDNPYRSLAFMLCCDDLERENGNESKAGKMFDLCKANGWQSISMKNDWKSIYGDGVEKTLGYKWTDLLGNWEEKFWDYDFEGRGKICIAKNGSVYSVHIERASSAASIEVYDMNATEASGGVLVYENGVHTIRTISDGNSKDEIKSTNGSGQFYLNSANEIMWDDRLDHAGDGLVFISVR